MKKQTFIKNAVYNTKEIAEIMGRHEHTIRKLIKSGRLAGAEDGAGFLVYGGSVIEYLQSRLILKKTPKKQKAVKKTSKK